MKKKLISMLTAMSLLSCGAVPALAENTITVPGEILYQQDFEGDVEPEMLAKIGASSAFSLSAEEELGNKVLKINGYGAYGYNKFGPEYSDAIVKLDFKQIGANGANGAYMGVGLRAARQLGGAYFSNMGVYFDAVRYNGETGAYDTSSELIRDRLGIVKTAGADYSKFTYNAAGNRETGILQKQQIFTSSEARAYERNFDGKYYRLQSSLIGTSMINTVKTSAGETLDSVSAEVSPVSTTGTGFTQLQAHSGVYLVDNIKIMLPAEISEFTVTPEKERIVLGEKAGFAIISEGLTIQPDTARYVYDPTAVSIDFADGTVAPLKEGTHTIEVFLDDISGAGSLSDSFTVTGTSDEKKLEVVIDNPNPEYGQNTAIAVYYGGADVTEEAEITGDADYFDGTLIPASTGLLSVEVSYNGQTVTVPLAVNNSSETIGEQEAEPVFSEDFEGDAAELTQAYSGGNANITAATAANSVTNTESQALLFNNIQASSALFGPENLKDYVLEYDFWCQTPKGSNASFLGATMRSNTTYGGYKVGYFPVMKYNEQTHMVDSALTANANRQIAAAYGVSNGIDKWYFNGFSGSSLQASVLTSYWFTQRSVISGNTISTELIRRDNSSTMAAYETTLASLDNLSGRSFTSGKTALSASQNVVYFDNVKIYNINSYSDIEVKYSGTEGTIPFEVVGVDENGGEAELSGTVSATATGAVTVSGNSFTAGAGVGYVTVCYTDGFGQKKYKVIRTGTPGGGQDAAEFALISDLKIYDESGNTLAALVSGKPIYAKADLTRTALGSSGVMLIVAVYDFDTEQMVAAEMTAADAVQRVGESFELYLKMKLPDNSSGSLYAKAMLIDTGLTPVTANYFEV